MPSPDEYESPVDSQVMGRGGTDGAVATREAMGVDALDAVSGNAAKSSALANAVVAARRGLKLPHGEFTRSLPGPASAAGRWWRTPRRVALGLRHDRVGTGRGTRRRGPSWWPLRHGSMGRGRRRLSWRAAAARQPQSTAW